MKIGFKLFEKDMTGLGFQYEVGKTYEEQDAKCASCGFHFAENPLDCLSYYPFKGSKKCVVGGEDYEEDGRGSRIAAKRITIIKELTDEEFIACCLEYIYTHPHLSVRIPVIDGARICLNKKDASKAQKGDIVGILNKKTGEISVYVK